MGVADAAEALLDPEVLAALKRKPAPGFPHSAAEGAASG
jgi:hypothetical protein